MAAYWATLRAGIRTSLKGLQLSWQHLKAARKRRTSVFVDDPTYFTQAEGIVTLQYPHEKIAVPDHGRYKLHNEMDDCIVCDKCAKICPVDCIDIEPIKAVGEVGKTSDGSSIRLYAAKFDIDMAKCCFCGLCTTVCPTECLTMTNEYDFSVFDVKDFNFAFGNLTPTEAQEKRSLYEQFLAEKEAAKAIPAPVSQSESPPVARPVFKPKMGASPKAEEIPQPETQPEVRPKPVFKPKMGASPKVEEIPQPETQPEVRPKPVFKPKMGKPPEA